MKTTITVEITPEEKEQLFQILNVIAKAEWQSLSEVYSQKLKDHNPVCQPSGVSSYLFHCYFNSVAELKQHFAVQPCSHIFHHNPPQLFIKLR